MTTKTATKAGLLSLLVSSFFFSTATTSRVIMDNPGTPSSVAAWRIFLGGAGIGLYVLYKYGRKDFARILKIPVVWLLGSFTFVFQLAMFYAAPKIGVAVSALIAIGSSSFLAGFFSTIFGFGKPTKIWMVSTVVAICGLTLLTGFNGNLDATGILAALSAGLMAALFVVLGVNTIRTQKADGILVNGVFMSIGAILAAPVALTSGGWIDSTSDLLLILYLGPIATTMGNIFYGVGLHNLSPGTVTTIMLLEPVLATIWGIFLLDEKLTTQGFIGCFVILSALALLAYSESKKPIIKDLEEVGTLA